MVLVEAARATSVRSVTGVAGRRWRGALIVRGAWAVVAVVALTLQVLGLGSELRRASGAETTWVALIGLLVGVVYTVAGGLLVWHRPNERMAQFAAFALLLFGTITFGAQQPAFVADYPSLAPTFAVLDVAGRAAFTALVYLFPDGHFVPGWTRWIAFAWIAIQVPVPFLALDVVKPVGPLVDALTGPLFVVGLATAAVSQVFRYRRVSNPAQREQTKWTAFGFAA